MFGEVGYITGQVLGGVAVALGFFTYQMKDAKKALIFELFVGLVFAAHYFFIGAFTAAAMNMAGPVVCIVYYIRNKRGSRNMFFSIVFAVWYLLTGLLAWEGWYSACLMVGLAVHTIAFSMPSTQTIRYAMFIKSPLCLIYNIMVLSIGGIVYECIVMVSSVIGTVRHRLKEKENGQV